MQFIDRFPWIIRLNYILIKFAGIEGYSTSIPRKMCTDWRQNKNKPSTQCATIGHTTQQTILFTKYPLQFNRLRISTVPSTNQLQEPQLFRAFSLGRKYNAAFVSPHLQRMESNVWEWLWTYCNLWRDEQLSLFALFSILLISSTRMNPSVTTDYFTWLKAQIKMLPKKCFRLHSMLPIKIGYRNFSLIHCFWFVSQFGWLVG